MSVRRISSGSRFEAEIGYSRAVVVDGIVHVSGTTGYDYATMELPEAVEDQCRNALANISRALVSAGSGLNEVVRVRYILPDRDDFPKCWPMLGQAFAMARPAATMIQAGLMVPEMKIEIEVMAILPKAGDGH
jgi:enamine deaminase RidA (YjgF/YER057c/UK114 family)